MLAEPVVYQMLVHLFGATSSPSVATFCLRQTATDFGCDFDPEIAEIVQRNFYVNDCLCSTTSPQKAISIVQQLTALLNKGGFRLTKWLTNCPKVLASIPVQERCASLQHQVINDNSKEMVLGVLWNVSDDTFGLHVTLPERPHTKRGVLSILSSLYDPLGFAAPITLGPKLLLQGLCKAGFTWDQSLTMEQINEWETWLKNLKDLNDLCIPKCLEPPDFGLVVKRQIHNFADPSAEAYGACIYLRTVNELGDIHCCLLIGKCRLAPIKTISIPKLELTAAALAVRLDTMIRRELSLDNRSSKFWSDSTAVLQTIKNSKKRFPVFVANRISVIETNSNADDCRYIPSKLNPADLASRGCTVQTLLTTKYWFSGPSFLWQAEELWPCGPVPLKPTNELDIIPRKNAEAFLLNSNKDDDVIDCLIKKYSSLERLKITVAWLLRGRSFLHAKVKSNASKIDVSPLSVTDLRQAENEIVKHEQKKHFDKLLFLFSQDVLERKKAKLPRHILKLSPIVVNGVLRVKGRLGSAPICSDAMHPVLLPNNSHFTELMIREYHAKVGHSEMGHTWSALRQRY